MTQGNEAKRLSDAYSGVSKTDSTMQWLKWGPYLSERQWGTVREDYSDNGDAWNYFSHDQARSRAYRWGEDGLAGISDNDQRLCFALALWNGQDPILKERLFGLTNGEGNHGEDVKEYYYYLDNTPTHSYMKWLYKYPQKAFPYSDLVSTNQSRKSNPGAFEYELFDTGIFKDNRYFDVQVEYAKVTAQDILIKIRVTNQGPDTASLHVLPTLWFRNTWAWFTDHSAYPVPQLVGQKAQGAQGFATIQANAPSSKNEIDEAAVSMMLYCQKPDDLFFVDNETNNVKLWNSPSNPTPYPKDGINDYLLNKQQEKPTVNSALTGTKASADYLIEVAPQATCEIRLRLSANLQNPDPFGADFDATFQARIAETDEFYNAIALPSLTPEERLIQRQAYAGMLWSKQLYYYVIADWLKGDPATPPPPSGHNRNAAWTHFYAKDVLSMPDAWEYPWFASWDLCFQSVVFARLDLEFAKKQLRLLAHEWYMSPKGAVPAYEWNFGDVNPPLHPWAALHIFKIEKEMRGAGDIKFLEDIFDHCLMYFTWWANQEDSEHKNLFQGGFLGLDNISIIDRSNLSSFEAQINPPHAQPWRSVELFQSDGTIWMGMFSLNMLEIAIKLVVEGGLTEYTPLATKFFQNAVFIADAFNNIVHQGSSGGPVNLWDETDGFYYDVLKLNNPDEYYSIKLRSLIGLMALFPTLNLDLTNTHLIDQIMSEPMQWFLSEHPEVTEYALTQKGNTNQFLLAFVNEDRLRKILTRVFDEVEFLSPYGIRSISKVYQASPYHLTINGATLTEQYEPAESSNGLFGGNSNWRGPVWFPINFLLIEKLTYYYDFLGDDFKIEYPTGSGQQHTLAEISDDLSQRLIQIFKKDTQDNRPVYGGNQTFQKDPTWQNLFLFYEYFHGDNGAGIGASHQTGWTGLVAELLNRSPQKGDA